MDSTLLKGLTLLELLTQSPVPVGVSALATKLALPKSNVHRTLGTLVSAGYVRRLENGTYEASLKVWELGMQVMKRNQLRRAAIAFMHALQGVTTETVTLVAPDGDDCLYIHQMEASAPLRISTAAGERAPAVMTISGRVMMAFYADAEHRAQRLYDAVSPRPPFGLETLLSDLKTIRQNGYAMSGSHWRPGINSMAGVICGPDGVPVGAIAVAGSKERFTGEKMQELVQPLLSACANVSRALGG
ncbi:MAG: IclR family transcriptional regulator [Pseudohongiella sp.]|nr:IclR family transcriptional regulator [Pseudohongiella sp.]